MNKEYTILKELESGLLENINMQNKRNLYSKIDWESNCVLIYWERWIWKTCMLLQKRKQNKKGFYFSADSHIIEGIWLFNFIFWIKKNYDKKVFYIDEIHKYSNWIIELKNIIDSFLTIDDLYAENWKIPLWLFWICEQKKW